MKILIVCTIIICFSSVVQSEAFAGEMMARSCEMLTRGVHADRDPLDEKVGRASRLFDLTYRKCHAYADQIEGASLFNLEIAESEDDHQFLESVPQLQEFASSTFNVDFLADLDRSLNQSLHVEKWTHLKNPQFGFTYSNVYKYQRDQLNKGGSVLHKLFDIYYQFQLRLDQSNFHFSANFQADLTKASQMSASEGGAYLVSKYGSLYISSAVFGGSFLQNDLIPSHLFHSLKGDEVESLYHLFWGDRKAGLQLLRELGPKSGFIFHRRTLVTARGGLFTPKDISQLSTWKEGQRKYPAIVHYTFASLSDLLSPKYAPLKTEIAETSRRQILQSVGRNLLDASFFSLDSIEACQRDRFPGFAEYAKKTKDQLIDYLASNWKGLVDPGRSPFVKADAIEKTVDYLTDLTLDNVGANPCTDQLAELYKSQRAESDRQLTECNQRRHMFNDSQMAAIQTALTQTYPYVDYFDQLRSVFKGWTSSNEKLAFLETYTENRAKLSEAKLNFFSIISQPMYAQGGVGLVPYSSLLRECQRKQ